MAKILWWHWQEKWPKKITFLPICQTRVVIPRTRTSPLMKWSAICDWVNTGIKTWSNTTRNTSSDSICHLVLWRDSDYSKQEKKAHRRSILKHLVLKFGSQEFHLHIFVSSLLYWSKSLFYSLTYSESIKWDRRPWHELVPMPLVVLSHITANSRNVFQPHW